ncbi:thioredoxin domain-containing protein 12 [Exaiptasia diaphana]|uniref:Thioredoxin domain-containing protein 12 n=1 Tax=Exaiptasia diaphana TaxID=2652724 RepID=A0A913WPW5_EXADI|nr:thioredoxin domain-containing protein 12 [Exaiptasia diaphana]KXJ18963.1 Thioredoxin domain-containing protein 12 [Exaiptasia diaphana]
MLRQIILQWKPSMTTMLCLFGLLASGYCSFNARGWGDHIDWKTLEEGKLEAQNSRKPMMIVVHKSWCGACKALKPRFSTSSEIADLSRKFVMVNLEDEEEPKDQQYHIDGSYIPRIFFLDSFGVVQKDITNKGGNPSYRYFYSNAESIVTSMKTALEQMTKDIHQAKEL